MNGRVLFPLNFIFQFAFNFKYKNKKPFPFQCIATASLRSLLSASTFTFSLSCTGEGNGNPLQFSCLENPRDGGAWWADIYGVTQSRTRLKWLSSSSNSTQEIAGDSGPHCHGFLPGKIFLPSPPLPATQPFSASRPHSEASIPSVLLPQKLAHARPNK